VGAVQESLELSQNSAISAFSSGGHSLDSLRIVLDAQPGYRCFSLWRRTFRVKPGEVGHRSDEQSWPPILLPQ